MHEIFHRSTQHYFALWNVAGRRLPGLSMGGQSILWTSCCPAASTVCAGTVCGRRVVWACGGMRWKRLRPFFVSKFVMFWYLNSIFWGVNADNVMLVLFCRSSRIEPFEGCELATTEEHVSKGIHFHAEQEASAGQAAPTNPYYPGQVWPCWACAGLWKNQSMEGSGCSPERIHPHASTNRISPDGVPWQDLTRDFCC